MTWKRTLSRALTRATGLEVRRAGTPRPAGRKPGPRRGAARRARLVQSPTFVICTLRSGSTLLRVLLDSHSQIHAPHELHLRYVNVHLNKWSKRSMRELGFDGEQLEYLLWDRLLEHELGRSGKKLIVDKTPNNVFIVDRLRRAWPDARFIFLLRHPAAIARSRQKLRPDDADNEANVKLIARYCDAVEEARRTHDGITVRYEDVTSDPAREMQRVCEFLGVPWEPTMLEYGEHDHGRFKSGLGDWADKIRTGRIQPPDPPPPIEDIPEPLIAACRAWGYLPPEPSTPSAAALDRPAS